MSIFVYNFLHSGFFVRPPPPPPKKKLNVALFVANIVQLKKKFGPKTSLGPIEVFIFQNRLLKGRTFFRADD